MHSSKLPAWDVFVLCGGAEGSVANGWVSPVWESESRLDLFIPHQLCPARPSSAQGARSRCHGHGASHNLTSPHPNRLATRQFRQLHLIINRSHQPALYSGISMHPPATCVLVRGSSHITSYVFGVSDTPWWLCHPVIF